MPVEFVNIHGRAWQPSAASVTPSKKAKSEGPAEHHKGWLVEGLPPGALEDAEASHSRVAAMAAKSGGKTIEPFDRAGWMMNARAKRVRSRAYETIDGALACKALAEKAGWLRVRVNEQKKVAA